MKLLCNCGHKCSHHLDYRGPCQSEGCPCQKYVERDPNSDGKTIWKVMYRTSTTTDPYSGQVWVESWRSHVAPTVEMVQAYWLYLLDLPIPIKVDAFRIVGGFNADTLEKHIVVI